MKCKNCFKELFESRHKFCSINCQDEYIINLEKMIHEIIKNDLSHTQTMSFSE